MTEKEIRASGTAGRISYFAIASRGIELLLKMTPIYMLFAGFMLWVHLRDLRWVSLLLPSATSASGLAFLAVSALTFIGMVIIVLLLPSFLLLCSSDIYQANKPMPRRVQWILVAMSAAWAVAFGLIGVSDDMLDAIDLSILLVVGFGLGLLGYALPGIWAALWHGNGSCADWRKKFLASWTVSLASHGPARPAFARSATRLNAPARGGFVLPNLERTEEASAIKQSARRLLGSVFLPAMLISMITFATFLTSLPVLVYATVFGTAIESSFGSFKGWIVLVVGGMLTMVPAFIYLHARSKNQGQNESAKLAFFVAGIMAFLTLMLLQYAPVKDRVFSLLEIHSTRKEFFQIVSPTASAALRELGFSVFEIADEEKSARDGAKKVSAPTLTVVQAWVGFSFGDTVLLCRRQVSEKRHTDPLFLVVQEPENVCLPLQRTELRRMPDIWASR